MKTFVKILLAIFALLGAIYYFLNRQTESDYFGEQ